MSGIVELNETTRTALKNLQNDINEMLALGSNMEVVWKLEKLHHSGALTKSADLIRKSLK